MPTVLFLFVLFWSEEMSRQFFPKCFSAVVPSVNYTP